MGGGDILVAKSFWVAKSFRVIETDRLTTMLRSEVLFWVMETFKVAKTLTVADSFGW